MKLKIPMNFAEEYSALQRSMPRLGLLQLKCENSSYTFATDQLKDCYLIMNAVRNERCMYGRDFYNNTDCVDCDHILDCELCYECVNCKNCYNGSFLQDCDNSSFCAYSYDLKGCENCIGCAGLRKKSYHIFNKPYSKEEYGIMKAKLTREEILLKTEEIKLKTPRLYAQIVQSESSAGDYIYNSENALVCFDIVACKDVGYCYESKKVKDSLDINVLEDSELCYEISSSHQLYNCNFCYMCVGSSDLELCDFVMYSRNCFACVGIGHKEYHILNRPYPKEEYFERVKEIKKELIARGLYSLSFIPPSYPYEDTIAVWPRL